MTLPNLKIYLISLAFNEFISIPSSICNIPTLKHLRIDHNSIANVPNDMSGLTSLEELQLSANEFEVLPMEVSTIPHIFNLSLSVNKITNLPEGIAGLTNISYLDVSFNLIDTLPKQIVNMAIGPEKINLCYNENLIFNEEQKQWFGVQDYQDYFNRYCFNEKKTVPVKAKKTCQFGLQYKNRSISFSLYGNNKVRLYLIDVKGRTLKEFINTYTLAGTYSFPFDKSYYSSGIYYFLLSIGNKTTVKKIVITN